MSTNPPGLWCPFATHKPIPEAWTQRAIDTRAVVVHSAGGHGELYGWWQSDASHGLESTFFICDDQTAGYLDGEIVQYLGLGIKADANGEANSFAASIETASTVNAGERWTPAQAESLTLLLDWICTVAPKVERRLMAHPTDAGIAWHVQFGAPGPWTQVRGKVCPGPERIKQLQAEIIPAVAAMANHPTPTPIDPQELTMADITEITKRLDAIDAEQARQGKQLDKLYQDYGVSREPSGRPGDNGSKRYQFGRIFLWVRDLAKG